MPPPERVRAEIAVIGSGPGGSVTAALLAEAGREVVLIEEGPNLPLDGYEPFSRQEMDDKYRNGGLTVAVGRPNVAYVEACCVGGGSEINSGLYHRTPAEVLRAWSTDYAVDGLSEADLSPHFEAIETQLAVSYLRAPAPVASRRLQEGAHELGWNAIEVPRWIGPEGASNDERRREVRRSMTEIYVPRFLAAGGTLRPDCRAVSLSRSKGAWEVRLREGGLGSPRQDIRVRTDSVFVACGAVQTAALLRRSGFGVRAGNTLKLHPTIKVVARFPDEVNSKGMGVGVHQVNEFVPDYSFGCAISSSPHLALALMDRPDAMRDMATRWRRMSVYYAMITQGNGYVRSLPLFCDPYVTFKMGRQALHNLSAALRDLCRVLFAAGADTLYPGVDGLGPFTQTSDLDLIPPHLPPQRTNLMSVHLMASCPMGERTGHCVVNSYGGVHGANGLFVADGSMLCDAPGVNPQGTIMALARRNALRFLDRY